MVIKIKKGLNNVNRWLITKALTSSVLLMTCNFQLRFTYEQTNMAAIVDRIVLELACARRPKGSWLS